MAHFTPLRAYMYTSAGYMFNIRMLKRVFEPVFELHDIRQTGEFEATTRWTMTMKVRFKQISC
jgi:hypothetical protein